MKPKVNLPKHLGSPNFQMWKRRKRMECEAVLKAMKVFGENISYTPAVKGFFFVDAYDNMKIIKEKLSNKFWKSL